MPSPRSRGRRGFSRLDVPKNSRLVYRKPAPDDLDFFRVYLSDPPLTRFLPNEGPYPEAMIVAYLENRITHWEAHGFGSYLLILDSRTVGYCGLEFVRDTPHIDLRYGLVQEVWGRGLAVEAARACLVEGFQSGLARTLYGAAMPENKASLAVLRKVGMTPCDVDLYGDEVKHFCISSIHTVSTVSKR